MKDPNRYGIETTARDLRSAELRRLAGDAACAARGAFARMTGRPVPACTARLSPAG
jgi:hypothetical protein